MVDIHPVIWPAISWGTASLDSYERYENSHNILADAIVNGGGRRLVVELFEFFFLIQMSSTKSIMSIQGGMRSIKTQNKKEMTWLCLIKILLRSRPLFGTRLDFGSKVRVRMYPVNIKNPLMTDSPRNNLTNQKYIQLNRGHYITNPSNALL